MSDLESRMVIRGRVRSLDKATDEQALLFFRDKLGEPDELDEYDGYVWFQYDRNKHEYTPIHCKGGWAIDYNIKDLGDQYHPHFFIDFQTLKEITIKMRDKFNILLNDISFQSYTWYNGVDEPRYLYESDI